MNYLDTLNAPQRAAVEYNDGASLVIAGAGSGKTRVLTFKIAYLLEIGMAPWNILALTFTNKAAKEMKERIAKIVGDQASRSLWMGTFHSIFLRILRVEHELVGFSSNFTIYDAADSKSLVKTIIKEMELDDKTYKPGDVLSTISNCKNHLITAEEYVSNSTYTLSDARKNMPELGKIYQRYSNRCKQSDAMDFDDILLYTFKLFDEHQEIKNKWEDRFKFVLVDEYQDTNYAQHRIVWQLTEHNQRLCVVGDDAQSIYSFRGANIDNILTFSEVYKQSKLFKLEQNYRSTQNIVEAANSLIGKNNRQIKKTVFSQNDKGDLIQVYKTHSDIEESKVVVKNIRSIKRAEGCEYSDFAILYRTNAQSRVLEESLRKEGLPYRIYGGLSFYQRKEIKDIIAYFRLVVNHNDEEAFRRIVNYPARGIGETTVSKIAVQANVHNTSLWNVVSSPVEYGLDVSKATMGKLLKFTDMIEGFSSTLGKLNAVQMGQNIVKVSGIINEIYHDTTPENLSRQENVEELLSGMQEFCDSRIEEGNDNISLVDYLSEVSLLSDVDSDNSDDNNKITLMTVHSAKGLEFANVFVVGLEEGLFPSQMCSGSPREMEEERRLMYVAVTRAKKRCILTYAQSRYRFGKTEFSSPSRFLNDIDSCYLDRRTSMYNYSSKVTDDVELPWMKNRPFTPSVPKSATNASSGMRRVPQKGFSPTRSQSSQASSYSSQMPSRTPSRTSASASLPEKNTKGLAVGSIIEHERFGRGKVTKIEGTGENLKATVAFDFLGVKQLLLKFAKYKLVD